MPLTFMQTLFQKAAKIFNSFRSAGSNEAKSGCFPLDSFLVFFITWFVYLLTVYPTVQTEDSGELIAAAATLDIAHPPGYPLYVLIGKLFTILIPFGNVAWRINIMSAFFSAATVMLLYLFLKKITKNNLLSMAASFFLAFNDTFWSQSIRAEVYSMNSFFFALLVYLLYLWHESENNKWLYWAAFSYGLSLGDHNLAVLAGPVVIVFVLLRKWKVLLQPRTVIASIFLFLVGVSVYAYLPIRTYYGSYDNPAFIDHSGLYTWEKFSGFVNRKIYGGTVNIDAAPTTQEGIQSYLPVFLIDMKNFVVRYWDVMIYTNKTGFIPLLHYISRQYFYFPLFFFLPGLYWLFKKNWRWGSLILMLFFAYTVGVNMFATIVADIDSEANFGVRPFHMPVLYVIMIITAAGFQLLEEEIPRKKITTALSLAFFILPTIALINNFPLNNESFNYIAYDFNRNALESVPPYGYLLTTGRDNMTFPLYYLRKVEGIRKDVTLEVYYASGAVSENFLRERLISNKQNAVFVDLAPEDFEKKGLKPFGFVYGLGQTKKITWKPPENFQLRGIRENMDPNSTRLVNLYRTKMGLLNQNDPTTLQSWFEKVIQQPRSNYHALTFIGDYCRNLGLFDMATRAYTKANNADGVQDIKDRKANKDNPYFKGYQSAMD